MLNVCNVKPINLLRSQVLKFSIAVSQFLNSTIVLKPSIHYIQKYHFLAQLQGL